MKQKIVNLSALVGLLSLSLCANAKTMTQQQLDKLADSLEVTYQVIDNLDTSGCTEHWGEGFCYASELQLTFKHSVENLNWQIYFSKVSPVQWEGNEHFDIRHINGDFHVLTPNLAIETNTLYRIPMRSGFWSVSKSDVMPNYFIVAPDLEPRIIKSTVSQVDPDTQLSYLPHAGSFETDRQNRRNRGDIFPLSNPESHYARNINANGGVQNSDLHVSPRIVPKAKQSKFSETLISLENGIHFPDASASSNVVLDLIHGLGVANVEGGIPVTTSIDKAINYEGYLLDIRQNAIDIKGGSEAGVFYALISLYQLIDDNDMQIPTGVVKDVPRYDFRGVHLDVSRNFHSKEMVLRLLEQMAIVKLNKLHFHLADDEGWRLEIPDLPELTEVGAFRCYDPSEDTCLLPQLGAGPHRESPVNGYFSGQDYIDILRFADARQIEVIPSLDMPGHSRAAVKSMLARYRKFAKQGELQKAQAYLLTDLNNESRYSSVQFYNDNTINPCIPSTYTFIEKVLSEVYRYHQQAGTPLRRYHIGADETAGAWNKSPACQKMLEGNIDGLTDTKELTGYFVSRIRDMVAQKGVIAGAWSDGVKELVKRPDAPPMQVNLWDTLFWEAHNHAHTFANAGWDAVLSTPDVLYFDFPYRADADEPGYYWASRATDSYKVFRYMTDNIPAHAQFWTDRMGHPYSGEETVKRQPGIELRGIQAQLWSESLRSDEIVEYMLFPRLFSLAERAWHKPDWEIPYEPGRNYQTDEHPDNTKHSSANDWRGFSQVMVERLLPRLDKAGGFFRLPVPGASVIDGTLHANTLFPGLLIEYKTKGHAWKPYQGPVEVKGTVKLRSKLPSIERSSQVISVEK